MFCILERTIFYNDLGFRASGFRVLGLRVYRVLLQVCLMALSSRAFSGFKAFWDSGFLGDLRQLRLCLKNWVAAQLP